MCVYPVSSILFACTVHTVYIFSCSRDDCICHVSRSIDIVTRGTCTNFPKNLGSSLFLKVILPQERNGTHETMLGKLDLLITSKLRWDNRQSITLSLNRNRTFKTIILLMLKALTVKYTNFWNNLKG
jgi:hypothetical protein